MSPKYLFILPHNQPQRERGVRNTGKYTYTKHVGRKYREFTKATGKHETYQTLSKILAHFGKSVTDLSHSDKKYIIVSDESC